MSWLVSDCNPDQNDRAGERWRWGHVRHRPSTFDITIYETSDLALADSNGWTVYTVDWKLLDQVADSGYDEIATHIRAYQS